MGTTLVWDWGVVEAAQALLHELEIFRADVNEALPGYYAFFEALFNFIPCVEVYNKNMSKYQAMGCQKQW